MAGLFDLIKPPRLAVAARRLRRRRLWAIHEKYRTESLLPGLRYIRNLELAERFRSTPGCIVECGVWRGGMIAGLAELLGPEREYFLLDSFEGLPPVAEIDGAFAIEWQKPENAHKNFNNAKAPFEAAEAAMKKSGVPRYSIVKGWFRDTLPNFKPAQQIALLRLDADLYESTSTCLEYLYPLLADDAVVIIDDYYDWEGCARAVNEFLARIQVSSAVPCLRQFDDDVCYFQKPRATQGSAGIAAKSDARETASRCESR
jgi:O-methyltransferase